MYQIELEQKPNQEISVEIENVSYRIRLHTVGKMITLADVYADGDMVSSAVRCVPGGWLIPFQYITKGGNFVFRCIDQNYPYYTLFGKTQNLYYLSNDEITAAGL